MSITFPNKGLATSVYKHTDLPLLSASEFDFYRIITFHEKYYGKTVSELHSGNLRVSRKDNRYSSLFPGQRLSYWADSVKTAKAEYKHWNNNKNTLMFWAYDDGSATFPTVFPPQQLTIIDGFKLDFVNILHKVDNHDKLSISEKELIEIIAKEEPDCLAYQSERNPEGVNFLFFEHGFKKLSLHDVKLYLGENKSQNNNFIRCADSSDYSPFLEGYGYKFLPVARTAYDSSYENTDEYKLRKQVWEYSLKKMRDEVDDQT